MNKHNTTIAQPQSRDAAISSAMRDMEGDICDLSFMSEITAQMFDDLKTDESGSMVTIKLTQQERELLFFAMNDVVGRSVRLKQAFYAACHAGGDA